MKSAEKQSALQNGKTCKIISEPYISAPTKVIALHLALYCIALQAGAKSMLIT